MNPLLPSIIATLFGTFILAAVYFYVYRYDRHKYLLVWTVGWIFYGIRFFFETLIVIYGENRLFLSFNHIATLASGILLLYGTYLFIGKKTPRFWFLASIAGTVWIFMAVFYGMSLTILSIPTFFFLAFVYIWTGVVFLLSSLPGGFGKKVTAISFIVWGIHKGNYPFLRPVEWFAPWGFMIGAVLEFIIALGILLIYYQKTKSDLVSRELLYRSLFESSNVGKSITSLSGEINVNKAFAEMLGYDQEELKHRTWQELTPSDEIESIQKKIATLLSGEKDSGRFEKRYIHKNGSYVWADVSVAIQRDNNNNPLHFITTVVDITEHKKADELLREERDRFASIVATAPGAICSFRVNKDGFAVFPYASPAIKDVYGLDPEDLVKDASLVQNLIHAEDVERIRKTIMSSEQTLAPWRDEFRFNHPHKGEVWIESHFTPLHEADGSTVWQGFFIDITAQHKLEEQLQQSQKIEVVGQLAGGIAHDFNNILSAIIGYANLAEMKIPEDSPVRNDLEQILESSQRATTLVQSLLAFSRKQPIILKIIDLNDVISSFEKFLLRLLREDIEFKTVFHDKELPVMADRTQIEQILMNLATNARDAMPGHGTFTIETSLVRLEKDFVDMHGYGKDGKYAMLAVSDTGTGMDERTKRKIFDPFFTTKEQGKGTGQGHRAGAFDSLWNS